MLSSWNRTAVLALLAIIPSWIGLLLTAKKELLVSVVLIAVLFITIWFIIRVLKEAAEFKEKNKIFNELAKKYDTLIRKAELIFSQSYIHSPFNVWSAFSDGKEYPMDYGHYQAIHAWIVDIVKDPPRLIGFDSKLRSFSTAVSESTKLVEKAHAQLQKLCESEELDAHKLKRLRQEWATARDEYNDWLRDCCKYFKEVNATLEDAQCCEYFPFVKTLE